MTKYYVFLTDKFGEGHVTLLGKYDELEEIKIMPGIFNGHDLVITIERIEENIL